MVGISRFVRFVKPVRSINLRCVLTAALMVTAPSVAMAQYTWVNSNNQTGNWNTAARWTGGPEGTFPNAIDATATLNPPLSNSPTGNYNVQLSNTAGQLITIGSLTVNNNDLTPEVASNIRIGANGNGSLTFQVSSGSATYTENAAAVGQTNFYAPVTFASDTIITQNQGAATANSGTQFTSSNNSPGGVTAAPGITVTKEGAGNINFTVPPTAPGTGFQGNLVINQGGVRVEENVFANAASVVVNTGGQFQLGAGAGIPNWNLNALTLSGQGKASGINPEGALRYQSNNGTGNLNAPINLASDSAVFVNANLAPVAPNPVTYGNLTLTGAVTGAGGLTKTGSGILVLSAANSYEGATVVNAGTLVAANATGSATGNGPVTVNAGATLAGAGTIAGDVSFVGGILAPGSSPNTLTLGNTTLDSASTLNYELATAGVVGSGINDLTVVNGNLLLDGLLNITDLGGFGIGTYTLFSYTGSLTDNGLEIGTAPAGFHFAIDTSAANLVNLSVTAVPEPSTLALVALGGVLLGGAKVVRRRKAGRTE